VNKKYRLLHQLLNQHEEVKDKGGVENLAAEDDIKSNDYLANIHILF